MGLLSAKKSAERERERASSLGTWILKDVEPPKPRRRGLLTHPRTYPPTPRTVAEYNAYRRAYNRGSGLVLTARFMDDLCYRIERLESRA